MNRINKKFNELQQNGNKALITFITAGDPDIETTEQLIYAQEKGGADIIEIGIPFSDPLADGPVIQAAALRALNKGITLAQIFDCIKKVRKNTQIPLAFLVYYNTVIHFGAERFVKTCSEIGIDGLIIPDLPFEEKDEIIDYINNSDVALIPLAAPTSGERIKSICSLDKGFIYCVSSLGVTGIRSTFYEHVEKFLYNVKENVSLPVCVGFGISNKIDVEKMSRYVDGVIVGSAIVKKIEETNGNVNEIENFVKGLKPDSF